MDKFENTMIEMITDLVDSILNEQERRYEQVSHEAPSSVLELLDSAKFDHYELFKIISEKFKTIIIQIQNKNNSPCDTIDQPNEVIDFSKAVYDPIGTIIESQKFKDAIQKEVACQMYKVVEACEKTYGRKIHIEIDDEEYEKNHNRSTSSDIKNKIADVPTISEFINPSIQCDFLLNGGGRILLNKLLPSEFCSSCLLSMNYFLFHMKVSNSSIKPKVIHFECTENSGIKHFGFYLHIASVYFDNIPEFGTATPWKISKQQTPLLNHYITNMKIIDFDLSNTNDSTIESLTIGVDLKST